MNLRKEFDLAYPDFPRGTPFWLDTSFQAFLDVFPQLQGVVEYFPSRLGERIYDGQEKIERLWSSYKDHGYGYLFYALVRVLKPLSCVELGVLHGFSLLSVAAALRDNDQQGWICGHDLFDDYEYRHETMENVSTRIEENALTPWVKLYRSDAYQVHEQYDAVDYLHVDISNNGKTFIDIFEKWEKKVNIAIIFEGGSKNRDQISWMSKYGKPPIVPAIRTLRNLHLNWHIVVLNPFPSISVAIKKGI